MTKKCGFILVMLLAMISSRSGLRTPIEDIWLLVEAIAIVGCLLIIATCWLRLLIKSRLHGYELLIIALGLTPLYMAWRAYVVFGQPLIYGMLAPRDYLLIGSGLFIYRFLIKNEISIATVEKGLIFACWVVLFIYYVLSIVINPESYKGTSFVGYNDLKGGYIIRVIVNLIVFGSIYYAVRFTLHQSMRDVMKMMAFFVYLLLFRQDRTILLTTAIGCAMPLLIYTDLSRKIVYAIIGLSVLFVLLVLLYIYKPDSINNMMTAFVNILFGLMGEETRETSVDARASEAVIAMKWVNENLIFGNGELSRQWNDGYEGMFGYFYPADLGLLGVIFELGVVGTIYVYLQYIYVYYISRSIKNLSKNTLLMNASKYTLFAMFLDSLTSGQALFFASASSFYVAILAALVKMRLI